MNWVCYINTPHWIHFRTEHWTVTSRLKSHSVITHPTRERNPLSPTFNCGGDFFLVAIRHRLWRHNTLNLTWNSFRRCLSFKLHRLNSGSGLIRGFNSFSYSKTKHYIRCKRVHCCFCPGGGGGFYLLYEEVELLCDLPAGIVFSLRAARVRTFQCSQVRAHQTRHTAFGKRLLHLFINKMLFQCVCVCVIVI